MRSKLNTGLVFIFLIFLLLFNQPILALVKNTWLGIPGIVLYLLIGWLLLIISMLIVFTWFGKARKKQ